MVVLAILTIHYQDRTIEMLFNQDSVKHLDLLHPHYHARLKDIIGTIQLELAFSVLLVMHAQVV